MKKALYFFFCLSISIHSFSQNNYTRPGDFQLGMRTTTSLFGHDDVVGLGFGGQYRIQLLKRLNTEWFADWITLDLKGAGKRENAHIGWSVLFYPWTDTRFMPYIAAGHCFDYARVTPLNTIFLDRSDEVEERWSSAVQMGLGTHIWLSDRFNLSLSAKYMLHLGKHLDYELIENTDGYYLEMDHNDPAERTAEGHLLITASLNYRLACFLKKHRRNNEK